MIKITKYKNRKLYTRTPEGKKGYVNNDYLLDLTRQGKEFKIETYEGEDVTLELLIQALKQAVIKQKTTNDLSYVKTTIELIIKGLN